MSLQVEIEKKLNDKVLSVSFDTEGKQGITGILGASGCGKSMTLKCIAGIETPDRGKIVLNGRVLFDSGKKINLRVQDRHVGYLFQNYALFPNMTVEKNIAAGFQYRPGQKMSAEEIKKQTADYMELLHVTELKSLQEKLTQSAQKVFAKMYEQAQAAQGAAGAGPNPGAGPDMGSAAGANTGAGANGADDDVIDADFKEV